MPKLYLIAGHTQGKGEGAQNLKTKETENVIARELLLKVFSESQIITQSDIVSMIERIAREAQITHGNLEIIVTADEQCRSYGIVSRLLP